MMASDECPHFRFCSGPDVAGTGEDHFESQENSSNWTCRTVMRKIKSQTEAVPSPSGRGSG